MAEISSYPAATTLDGTERLLGDAGPIDTPTTKTVTPTVLQSFIILTRDADQLAFERALSANGVTFNGSSDDAPGIQAAINAVGNDAKIHHVALPPAATGTISSENSCSFADEIEAGLACGLVLPATVVLNLNGANLTVSAAGQSVLGSGGAAIGVAGNTHLTSGIPVLQLHTVRMGNGVVNAPGIGYGLYLGNDTADLGPARIALASLAVVGRPTYAVRFGSNVYINAIYDSILEGSSIGLYAYGADNAGEAISLYHVVFDNQGQGIYATGGYTDIYCYGCSFDFLAQAIVCEAGAGARVSIEGHGCHFEFDTGNSQWGAGDAYIKLLGVSGSSLSAQLFCGTIQQDGGNSGTQLAYFADPGSWGLGAPWGITLDRVKRTFSSGTVINNTGATNRFVDNP